MDDKNERDKLITVDTLLERLDGASDHVLDDNARSIAVQLNVLAWATVALTQRLDNVTHPFGEALHIAKYN